MDVAIIVAIVGVSGVGFGHLITGWGKKKHYDLDALQAAVSVLQAEHQRLTKQVDALWDEVDVEREYTRVLIDHINNDLPPPPPPRPKRVCRDKEDGGE